MIDDSEVGRYFQKISEQLEEVVLLKSQMIKIVSLFSDLVNVKPSVEKTELLNIKEAAVYLKMAYGTLYRKHAKGEIKGYKNGGLKFKISDLDDYLLGKASRTVEEITNEANDYCLKRTRK